MVHKLDEIATKSLIRRLKIQLEPEKMAQFLAATIDASVLQRAQDIIIGHDLDELQERVVADGTRLCPCSKGSIING